MAQLAVAAVGAVIGNFIAPVGWTFLGMTGASLGWAIGGAIGGSLFQPKQPDTLSFGPRLEDTSVQTSTEGVGIPEVWGSWRLAGNVIWATPIAEATHISVQEAGGKGGGGGSSTTITYTYSVSLAVGLCEGEITGVRRIWADTKLLWDASAPPAGALTYQEALAAYYGIVGGMRQLSGVRVYTGSETQLADPLIQAHVGAANAPAFRGTAYVVIEGLQLGNFGNRIPNFTAEVVTAGTPSQVSRIELRTDDLSRLCFLAGASDDEFQWTYTGGATPKLNRFYLPTGVLVQQYPTSGAFEVMAGLRDGSVLCWTNTTNTRVYPTGATATISDVNWGSVGAIYERTALLDHAGNAWVPQSEPGGTNNIRLTNVSLDTLWKHPADGSAGGTIEWSMQSCAVAGRFYLSSTASSTLRRSFGYVDLNTLSFVTLLDLGLYTPDNSDTYAPQFCLDESGNFYLLRRLYPAQAIEKYSPDGVLLDSVTITDQWGGGSQHVDWWFPRLMQGGLLVGFIGYTGFYNAFFRLDTERMVFAIGAQDGDSGALLLNKQGPAAALYTNNAGGAKDKFWLVNPGDQLDLAGVALSTVVGDLAARAGVTAGELEATALTDTVRGYVRARPMTARAALEPLAGWFLFDLFEGGGKVNAVKRGGAAAAALTAEDLGAALDGEGALTAVESARAQEVELPQELSVAFADVERDHQPGVAAARRLVGESVNQLRMEFPILATSEEGAQRADILLRDAWRSRARHQCSVLPKWARLDPTDVITLPVGAETVTARLARVASQPGGPVRLEAVVEDPGAYTSSASGTTGDWERQLVAVAGPTAGVLLDLPALRDQDGEAGIYAAGGGYLDAWHGAALYRSPDEGITWAFAESLIAAAALGTATTALATGRTDLFDETNRLTVHLYTAGATLESATEASVLNGANACALGNHGRWEILQFKTATDNGDGTWTLSGLLRGRRGTEWAMTSHAVGDVFVLLTSGTLRRLLQQSADLGAARLWKFATFGQVLDTVSAQSFTYAGANLECYAPCQLGGGRNGAADIIINWVRRNRLAAEWRDLADIPMSEAAEAYELEIWTTNFATLKRTVTGLTSATTTYTAAQQASDFGSTQASVGVKVYQMSATVGRGYALQGLV